MKYVVTDNDVDAICTRLYKKYPIAGFDEFHDDLREAIAHTLGEPVDVPDKKQPPTIHYKGDLVHESGYVSGWNACREAMLSAAEGT